MHMRQERVRPVATARRRSATVGAALAAVGALGLATAAPASAEVKSTCGTYICVATAYQGRDYVQDITVTTRDGLPGTLRAFVGDYGNRKAKRVAVAVRRQPRDQGVSATGRLRRSGSQRAGSSRTTVC